MTNVTAVLVLVLLTALAAALRYAVTRGIWLDEAISIDQAHMSPAAIVRDLASGDRHPPLHHLILWATIKLFGSGDLAVRVPSMIAGTLIVPVIYGIAAKVADRRTGLVAALFCAIAPLLVWYSQEARGYIFAALGGSLAVLGALRALDSGRWRDWLLFALGASIAVWSHWFGGLLVGALIVLIVAVLAKRRAGPNARRFAAATGLFALQLVPLALLAVAEMKATGTGGGFGGADGSASGISFYTIVSNTSWALVGFHSKRVTDLLPAVWPLFMLAALLLLGRRMTRRTGWIAWLTLAPVLVLGAIALKNPSLFEIRYAIVVVPLIMVLLAVIAMRAIPSLAGRVALIAGITLILGVALADQQLSDRNVRRYDYREALAQVRRQMGPRDVLMYEPPELRYVFDHYAPGVRARPLEGPIPTPAQAPQIFVVGSFLDQQRYVQVVNRQIGALRYYRKRVGVSRRDNVTVWRFR